ncbi:MAG: quinolinate synthase NadA [Fidelibacterota bacterium]
MTINPISLSDPFFNKPGHELDELITRVKRKFGRRLLILGHHYMSDAIIAHADRRGDSFALAKIAAAATAEYIVFCGVHFMAETADIVTRPEQQVFIPDPTAGCFLADCARIESVVTAWRTLRSWSGARIVPITYVNSGADLKAFCGENGGLVCTSSNAAAALTWAFERGDKVFFFPDQHLGRNTAYKMGIDLAEIILWNSDETDGAVSEKSIRQARVILWDGFCDVHQEFDGDTIERFRREDPRIRIIVHPECNFDVARSADEMGSTADIIEKVKNAPPGTHWAIGTEKNLVNRLQNEHPEQRIEILHSSEPACRTMAQISLEKLAFQLDQLDRGNLINRVVVAERFAAGARKALQRMLELKS